tara:strand:- start:2031 stop:2297 length:267 start_codon:yes stop_codon:yes gene_type:complete
MSGAKRKIQRAKKKRAQKELQEKMNMFDKLGDACMTCDKPFDKKDREQVQSWNVVVRKKENKVNLYCPECWTKAKDIIEEFTRRQNDN